MYCKKILSRVDERIGFQTPQQPINLGANTDRAQKVALNDDYGNNMNYSRTLFVHRVLFVLAKRKMKFRDVP